MRNYKKRETVDLTSHGINCVTDDGLPYYNVQMHFALNQQGDRPVDFSMDAQRAESLGASLARVARKARAINIGLTAKRFAHDGGEIDVHTEHCCERHGCKYGDEECSVVTGAKPQSFLCESCDEGNTELDYEDGYKAGREAVKKEIEALMDEIFDNFPPIDPKTNERAVRALSDYLGR